MEDLDGTICEWTYSIKHCERTYLGIMICGTAVNGILGLTLFFLFCWRYSIKLTSKKKWSRNLFSPKDKMMTLAIFFFIMRALSCLVLIFDIFSSSSLFRESIYGISWIPGFISLYWYLHRIIIVIPKICFDSVNSTSIRKMFIPPEEQVRLLTWITIFLTSLCIAIPSIVAANFRERYHNLSDLKEARRTQIIFFWSSCLLVWGLIVYYGRAVVVLTKESLTLVEDDQWMKQVKEKLRNKRRLQANIKKMEAYNWVCGIVFFFWSIVLIPPMINYNIMEQKVVSAIYSFFSNDVTPVFFGFLIYTIIKETSTNTPTSESYDEHISTWLQSGNENTVSLQISHNLKHDSINTSELCYDTNIHEINSLRSQSGTEEYQDANMSNTTIDSNQNNLEETDKYQDNLAETDEHQDNLAETDEHHEYQDTNISDNISDPNQDNSDGIHKQQDTNTSDNIIDSNQDNLEETNKQQDTNIRNNIINPNQDNSNRTYKQQDTNTSNNIIDSNQGNSEGIDKQQDTNTSNNIIDSNQDNLEETNKQQDTNIRNNIINPNQDNSDGTDKQQDTNTSNNIIDSNQDNLGETDKQDTNTSNNINDSNNQDNLGETDKQDTNTSDNIIDSNQNNLKETDEHKDTNTSNTSNTSNNVINSNQDNLVRTDEHHDTNSSDNIIDFNEFNQDNLEETSEHHDIICNTM